MGPVPRDKNITHISATPLPRGGAWLTTPTTGYVLRITPTAQMPVGWTPTISCKEAT